MRILIAFFWLIWTAIPAHTQSNPAFNPKSPAFEPLTETERGYAKTAWTYFAKNTDPETGLVPSVRNFKSMTMWDEGAYLLATVSAYRLGIISRDEASGRMLRAFNSVMRLPLYKNTLPNTL